MPSKKSTTPFVRLSESGKPVTTRAKSHALVKDTSTGLTWSAKALQVSSWKDAEQQCKAYRLGGHKDWRMPTVKELFSIVDHTKREPAIDTKAFPETPSSWFWSSSPVVGWPEGAWLVNFYSGNVYSNGRYLSGFVRPVRAARPRQ